MAYSPRHPSDVKTLEALVVWIEDELRILAQSLNLSDLLQEKVLHVEPPKPRDGMIVYADGTNWDPGMGEGFYGREAGAWVKL